MSSLLSLLLAAAPAFAFPASEAHNARATDNHDYIPPGPNDARTACPGLNTLANHGYLPRNGRQVSVADMSSGFLNGWGMDNSTISTPLGNAMTVCHYVMGHDCRGVLPNLTILAEPHTFEHDHSLSRQDYRMAYAHGGSTDNFNYNQTIFNTILKTVGSNTHTNFQLMNEARLAGMSRAFSEDYSGWFSDDTVVQGVEIGFIFGVISDPTLPDAATNPQIRTDWWKYWFVNESFPFPLGWRKPNPPRQGTFVQSVSAAVINSTVTSTPNPVVEAWISPTAARHTLPPVPTVPILPIVTDHAYVAPDPTDLEKISAPQKRHVARQTGAPAAPIAEAVKAAASNQPFRPNPYVDEISLDDIAQMRAQAEARLSSVQAAVQSAT